MQFPQDQAPAATTPVSIRLPTVLLARIDADVAAWNKVHAKSPETRSDRIIYLLEYAYQAGSLNQFIDLMKAQYLEILAVTPEQIAAGAASHNQVRNLADRVNDIDDKMAEVLALLIKLTAQ